MVNHCDVAPFTGAWIEILISCTPACPLLVAPFTGAWIEIRVYAHHKPLSAVAPFTGAWIEMRLRPPRTGQAHTSLPSRERGLKLTQIPASVKPQSVAPFAGAWIEIATMQTGIPPLGSLPSRERGLKSRTGHCCASLSASLPSRERGLKYDTAVRIRHLTGRSLHGSDTDSRISILPSSVARSPSPHNLSPNPIKTFAHVMTHVL